MSTEENKAIARRSIEELWNRRNVDVIDELFAEDYHDPMATKGLRQWKDALSAFLTEAPLDLNVTIEDQIAEGEKVATRYTWSCTHMVALFGAEPTGKHISWTGISIYRLEGGKIVEGWFNNDDLALQRQLGLIA
jgi:predicted ester cyclase